MSCSRKLKTVGLVLFFAAALLTSCGGDSNSNLEMSLRAQLAETQSQLEQAQDLIVELQADLAASESPAETPTPDINPEGEDEEGQASEVPAEGPNEEEIDSLLTGTYLWLQQSDETVLLQEYLGVDADGWYGSGTRAAHVAALEERDLPLTGVPEIPCTAQEPIEEAIGAIESTSDPIAIDLDGDGVSDEVSIVVVGGNAYVTAFTSYNGAISWIEFGTWDTYSTSDAAYTPEFGTDINEDGSHELWVKITPFEGPAGGVKTHFVYIFVDCGLQVVTDTANGNAYPFFRGNTVSGETYYIRCVTHEEESLLVYHEDYRIGEPDDFVWAYVPTALRLTGASMEEVISSVFEDDIAPAPNPLPTDSCTKYS